MKKKELSKKVILSLVLGNMLIMPGVMAATKNYYGTQNGTKYVTSAPSYYKDATLTIDNEKITSNTNYFYGVYSTGNDVSGGIVNISGTDTQVKGIIYGGYGKSQSLTKTRSANSNVVNIYNGTIDGSIYGGYSEGSKAQNNKVIIEGGTINGTVYAARSTVILVGKLTDAFKNNVVTVRGTGDLNLQNATLSGYETGSSVAGTIHYGYSSEASLNVERAGVEVGTVQRFGTINFTLPQAVTTGSNILTVGTMTFDNTVISFDVASGVSLTKDTVINLISATNITGDYSVGTIFGTEDIDGTTEFAKIEKSGNVISLTMLQDYGDVTWYTYGDGTTPVIHSVSDKTVYGIGTATEAVVGPVVLHRGTGAENKYGLINVDGTLTVGAETNVGKSFFVSGDLTADGGVTVAEKNGLTIEVDNLQSVVTVNTDGTLTLTSNGKNADTLQKAVTGAGTLKIDGTIYSNAGNIGAATNVTKGNNLILTGDTDKDPAVLGSAVTGEGTLSFFGNVASDASYLGAGTVRVAGGNTTLTLNSGTLSKNIYGGYLTTGEATGTTINVINVTVNSIIYGGYATAGDVTGNKVNVSGNSTVNANIYGGYAEGNHWVTDGVVPVLYANDANNNMVTISGGTFNGSTIYGGYSQLGDAKSNEVTINDGTINGTVYGAYSGSTTKEVTGNKVTINGGIIKGDVYGAYILEALTDGDAKNNSVIISGGTFGTSDKKVNIYAARGGSSQFSGNSVTINGSYTLDLTYANLWGYETNVLEFGKASGATLNIERKDVSVNAVKNFGTINFTLSTDISNGDTVLAVDNGVSLKDVTVNVYLGNFSLTTGETITLIDNVKDKGTYNLVETGTTEAIDYVITLGTSDDAGKLLLKYSQAVVWYTVGGDEKKFQEGDTAKTLDVEGDIFLYRGAGDDNEYKGITTTGSLTVGAESEVGKSFLVSGALTADGGVTVQTKNTLTIDPDNLKSVVTVNENGILELISNGENGDTLSKAVIGEGTLKINGDISADANYIGAAINTVASGKTLTLTEGTLAGVVTGDGTLLFAGDVTSNASNLKTVNVNVKSDKILTLDGGELTKEIHGGTTGTTVNVNGVTVNSVIYGGYSTDSSVTGNSVIVSGNSIVNANIYGGYASGKDIGLFNHQANNNKVIVYSGIINGIVYGGYSEDGGASNNEVIIGEDAIIKGTIYGGRTNGETGRDVQGNIVTVEGGTFNNVSIYGYGHVNNLAVNHGNKNTLNVKTTVIGIKEIGNFDIINFTLPSGTNGPITMLDIAEAGNAVTLNGIEVSVYLNGYNGEDTITLIDNVEGKGTCNVYTTQQGAIIPRTTDDYAVVLRGTALQLKPTETWYTISVDQLVVNKKFADDEGPQDITQGILEKILEDLSGVTIDVTIKRGTEKTDKYALNQYGTIDIGSNKLTIDLSTDTKEMTITGNLTAGNVVVNADNILFIAADNLNSNVTVNENGTLALSSSCLFGDIAKAINSGDGTFDLETLGGILIEEIIDKGILNLEKLIETLPKIINEEDGSLNLAGVGEVLKDIITGDGIIDLTSSSIFGDTLSKKVSGDGTLRIDGTIYSDAGNIGAKENIVSNGKTLILTGGNLAGAVTGEGTLLIDGDVKSDASYLGADTVRVASGQQLTLDGGELTKDIYGGYALIGNAKDTTIVVNEGTTISANIYGGYSSLLSTSGNSVVINGGDFKAIDIYGGRSFILPSVNNTVTINGGTFEGTSIYGGVDDGLVDLSLGNTLNVNAKANGTIKEIDNFKTINFGLSNEIKAGDVMLSVTNAVSLGGILGSTVGDVTVNVYLGDFGLEKGKVITLIDKVSGNGTYNVYTGTEGNYVTTDAYAVVVVSGNVLKLSPTGVWYTIGTETQKKFADEAGPQDIFASYNVKISRGTKYVEGKYALNQYGTINIGSKTLTIALSTDTKEMTVAGNLTAGNVEIIGGNTLFIDADNLKSTVTVNADGILALTSDGLFGGGLLGDTLSKKVSGEGTLRIDGTIYSDAGNIGAKTNIVSDGKTLMLTCGTLAGAVIGAGTLRIGSLIPGTTVFAKADYIGAAINTVDALHTLALTDGTLRKEVIGLGTLLVDGVVTSNADNLKTADVRVANGKTLTLRGGTLEREIRGGYSLIGNATGTTIVVKPGTTINADIYGGHSLLAGTNGNSVVIDGGRFGNVNIYGGRSFVSPSINNSVTINGGIFNGTSIHGGVDKGLIDFSLGNTLNVNTQVAKRGEGRTVTNKINTIDNFQIINFTMPEKIRRSLPILAVENAVSLNGVTVNVSLNEYDGKNTITLIDNVSGKGIYNVYTGKEFTVDKLTDDYAIVVRGNALQLKPTELWYTISVGDDVIKRKFVDDEKAQNIRANADVTIYRGTEYVKGEYVLNQYGNINIGRNTLTIDLNTRKKEMTVDGNLSAGNVVINRNNTLFIDADNLKSDVTVNRNGTLALTSSGVFGDTLSREVTGKGTLEIDGMIFANADYIGATTNVTKGNTLTLTGGELTERISGKGNVTIGIGRRITLVSSDFANFRNDGNLTVNAWGTLATSGTINKDVLGKGTVKLTGASSLVDGKKIEGTLNGNGQRVNMVSWDKQASIDKFNVGTLTGNLDIALDVDMSKGISDKLVVGNLVKDAEVKVYDINITKDIAPRELVLPNTENNSITFMEIGRDWGGTSVVENDSIAVVTNNYQYTFTAGETGKLNYKVEAIDLTFKKFMEGTLSDGKKDPATLSLTDDLVNKGKGSKSIIVGNKQSNKEINVNLNGHKLTSEKPSTVVITLGKTLNLDGGNITRDKVDGVVDANTKFSVSFGAKMNISGNISLAGDIANKGNVTFAGTITAIGTLSGAGSYINSGTLTIADASKLQMTKGLENSGTIDLGGATASASGADITGTGTVNIIGQVSSAKSIANKLVITTTGDFTSTGTISGVVENNNKFTVGGGNVHSVVNNSEMKVTAPVTIGSASFAAGSTLTLNGVDCVSAAPIQITDTITVADGAKLYMNGVVKNQVYSILGGAGVTGTVADYWNKEDIESKGFRVADVKIEGNVYQITFSNDVPEGTMMKNILTYADSDSDVVKWAEGITHKHGDDVLATNEINAMAAMGENLSVTRGALDSIRLVGATITDHLYDKPLVPKAKAGLRNVDYYGRDDGELDIVEIPVASAGEVMPKRAEKAKHNSGDAWARFTHNRVKVDGLHTGDMKAQYSAQYNGVSVGYDLVDDQDITLGVALHYADGNATNGFGGHNDSIYTGISIYAQKLMNEIVVSGDMTYLHGKNEMDQAGVTANAKTNTVSVGFDARRPIKVGKGYVTPFTGMRYNHVENSSYTDSLGINRSSSNVSNFVTPLGVRYGVTINEFYGWTVQPFAEIGYLFNYGDKGSDMKLRYGTAEDTFGFNAVDRNTFFTRAGMSFGKKNITAGVGYDYMKSSNSNNNKWNVNVTYSF